MPKPQIPTSKLLSYAEGFIELGLLNDAANELEKVAFEDRLTPPVLFCRIKLYMAAKQWDMVEAMAKPLVTIPNVDAAVWVHWAYAVRRLRSVSEAKDILLKAEPIYGKTCGMLQFNLACYECVLGNITEARKRLRMACKLDKQFKALALDEPDLKGLRDEIAAG